VVSDAVIACFLVEPTSRAARSLRRYTYSDAPFPTCSNNYGHDAETPIEPARVHVGDDGCFQLDDPRAGEITTFDDDDRWPTRCARCGWTFDLTSDQVIDQIAWHVLYGRVDGRGEPRTLRNLEPGAMYYADWYDWPEAKGPDGRALIVILPPDGHPWHVDGRANNCDSPCATCGHRYYEHNAAAKDRAFKCDRYVDAKPHKCWVRHGTPPNVHVDKNGVTCGAGAGSIQTPRYHGFLNQGRLVQS